MINHALLCHMATGRMILLPGTGFFLGIFTNWLLRQKQQWLKFGLAWVTLQWTNIAMEHDSFVDDSPIHLLNMVICIAMSNYHSRGNDRACTSIATRDRVLGRHTVNQRRYGNPWTCLGTWHTSGGFPSQGDTPKSSFFWIFIINNPAIGVGPFKEPPNCQCLYWKPRLAIQMCFKPCFPRHLRVESPKSRGQRFNPVQSRSNKPTIWGWFLPSIVMYGGCLLSFIIGFTTLPYWIHMQWHHIRSRNMSHDIHPLLSSVSDLQVTCCLEQNARGFRKCARAHGWGLREVDLHGPGSVSEETEAGRAIRRVPCQWGSTGCHSSPK